MARPAQFETVPLSGDDKNLLLLIFRRRLKILGVTYAILLPWCFKYSGTYIDTLPTAPLPFVISLILFLVMIVGTGLYFFLRKVYCFKRDADSGVKEMVPYTIVRKEYFEYTGQYFVALNDPDYLHHEVDVDLFSRCSEGDCLYLYRARHSQYVFEMNGRFTLM